MNVDGVVTWTVNEWIEVPMPKQGDHHLNMELGLKLNTDGGAEGRLTMTATGVSAFVRSGLADKVQACSLLGRWERSGATSLCHHYGSRH